jgi:hypothetical protein
MNLRNDTKSGANMQNYMPHYGETQAQTCILMSQKWPLRRLRRAAAGGGGVLP